MADGWVVHRLPRSHWHCQLSQFDWRAVRPSTLQKYVTTFLEEVEAGKAPHLILTGAPGIGKSHIGVGVYRSVAAGIGTGLATWIQVPTFCAAIKQSYRPGEVDPWADFEDAKRLVVLDDLFGKELTPHEKDQIVTRLIDTAYQNGAGVLVTMNQPVEELAHSLHQHEVSRILADATIIPMSADQDWRRG